MDKTLSVKKPASEGKLERRQRLIEATITAIARYGLNHVTLDKVAKLAGLVAGTVNFHFNGKEELLLESMRYLADSFLANLNAALQKLDEEPALALQAIADIHMDADLSSHDKILAWYNFWVEVNASEEYRRVCSEVDQEYLQAYVRVCEKLFVQANKPVHSLQIQALARAMAGVMNQVWEELISDDSQEKRAQAKLMCQAFFASVFPWAFSLPPVLTTSDRGSGHSAPLAAWTFTLDELCTLEKNTLFKNSWQFLSLDHSVQQVGDYVTTTLLDEPLLIVQGQEKVRVFYNVCRHHPHPVVAAHSVGHGVKRLVCEPYGWQYDETGALQTWPPNLTLTLNEKEQLHLLEAGICALHGTLWACLNNTLNPSDETLLALLAEKCATLNLKTMAHRAQHQMMANWKMGLDIVLSNQMANSTTHFQVDADSQLSEAMLLSQRVNVQGQLGERWLLMPNMLITWVAQGCHLVQFLPRCAEQTHIREWSVGLDASTLAVLQHQVQHIIALANDAQTCLKSSASDSIFLASNEVARKTWQAWLQEKLPVLRLSCAPTAGQLVKRNYDLMA